MQIVGNLKENYSHLFDFKDDFELGDYRFDLYAKYHQENLKYFGSKKVEIYSFTNNEHLFYRDLGEGTVDFEKLKNFCHYIYNDFIEVDDKHMSSTITMIYSVNKVDEQTKKLTKKFSFYKSYMFGLKGFVNCKLIVLDVGKKVAYENRLAKGDAKKLKLFA